MRKIPTNILVYTLLTVGSVVIVGIGTLLYSLYGDKLNDNTITDIRVPDNFKGGLTAVHEGVSLATIDESALLRRSAAGVIIVPSPNCTVPFASIVASAKTVPSFAITVPSGII